MLKKIENDFADNIIRTDYLKVPEVSSDSNKSWTEDAPAYPYFDAEQEWENREETQQLVEDIK